MDQRTLFRLLRQDSDVEGSQFQVLHGVVTSLFTELGKLHPEQAAHFTQMSKQLTNEFNQCSGEASRLARYFAGQGPVARRLREHALVHEWLRGEDPALDNVSEVLAAKLKLFDFTPIEQPEVVNDFNRVLSQMVVRTRTGVFTTPFPTLPPQLTSLDELHTGIYAPPPGGPHATLVLRVGSGEVEGAMRAVFMAATNSVPALFFYHPWEHVWLQSLQWTVTFPGLRDALQEEFGKALAAANAVPQGYDFSAELAALSQKSNTVFDRESLLPAEVHVSGNDLCYKATDDTRSEILIRSGDYVLSFINTRGEYPARSGPCIITREPVLGELRSHAPQSLPVDVQRALVARGRAVMSHLVGVISENVSKGVVAIPRQALDESSEAAPSLYLQ